MIEKPLSPFYILNEDGALLYRAVAHPSYNPTELEKALAMIDYGLELIPKPFYIEFKKVRSIAEEKKHQEEIEATFASTLFHYPQLFCLLDVPKNEAKIKRIEFNTLLEKYNYPPIY